MKKKKLLLPLAVMTLSCGLAAGVLTGCRGHEHEYTEYRYDETGHWQICVEDGEATEKVPHVFGDDDTCVCGAEKPSYGTASGNVKMLKLGEYVEDFTGVTIDTGEDDGIEIEYDTHTGAFTVANARVGKTYKLSITKSGYLTSYVNLQAVKDQNVALGECVLQYDAFTHGSHTGTDWNGNYGTPSKIDKTHVNDAENPYFTIGEGTGDFYVYTRETYDTVSAGITYKQGDTNDITDEEKGNQAIHLVFEDGKAVMIRIEKLDDGTFKAQWIGGSNWEETNILGDWDFGTGEEHFNPLSEALTAQYRETGVELRLVRNGSVVYAYVNGEKAGEQILPEEYATQKCRVAFAAGHPKGGAQIPFSISKTLPEGAFDSALTLETGELPEGVNVFLDKEENYKRGDLVTLTVTLPQDGKCSVTAIDLGTTSLLDRYENGKVSFLLTEAENTLKVTVKGIEYTDLTDVSVTGKKYDVTGNSIADGTTLTLKGQGGLEDVEVTVTGGKFSKEQVAQGSYMAQLTGYKSAQITVGANGIEGGITLEYDGFEMLPINYDESIHDFSEVNDGIIKVNGSGGQSLDVVTKDTFTDVSVTINVKDSVAGVVQGIVLKFEDGKYVLLNFKKDQTLIQYRPDCWGMISVFGDRWIEHAISQDDINAFNSADGIDLTLVRKGGMLYAFLGDKYIAADELPEGYATQKVQVGFFAFDVKANASWNFEITQTVPVLASAVELTKNVPENAEGVEISLDKTEYALGETVTLTVTLPAEGYVVSEITLNGASVLAQLDGSTLKFAAAQAQNTLVVTVVERRFADVDVSVTGKKYDVTGNSIADGTTVTLVGQGGLDNVTAVVANGKITAEDVVQGTYTAQVEGYQSVDVTVGANGIEGGITLEYDGFEMLPPNYDASIHDFSEVNDGIIKVNGNGGQSLDVVTKDSYTDVAVTINVKDSVAGVIQGIVLKFEDGKYVLLNFKKDQTLIQYRPDCWGMISVFGDRWIEHAISQDDIDAFNSADGINLTLVRKGGMLYAFLGDKFIAADELPEGYATQKVQVGFFAFDVKPNASWNFEITQTLPALTSTVELTKNVPENAEGVEISVDKTEYALGETVTLTVTLPAEGYVVSEITLNGASVLAQLDGSTLEFAAAQAQNTLVVTVVERRIADVDVSVTGKKYDVTGSSIADGTTVTLVGQGGLDNVTATVVNGKITEQNVVQGTYTAQVEGYQSVDVTVGENGIETPIVFEYDGFIFPMNFDGEVHDLSKVNDEQSQIGCDNKTLNVLTKDSYDNVSVSLTVKDANSRNGNDVQGIWLKFENGKYLILRSATWDNRYRLTYLSGSMWDAQTWLSDEINFYFFSDEEENEIKGENGIELRLVREGGKVYAFLGGKYVYSYELPAEYATSKVQVGFWDWDSAEKAVWDFNITKTFDLTATVTNGTTDTNGTVQISSTEAKYGDTVTVTLTPSAGYVLKSLTVGGKDVTGSVTFDENKVGTYSFTATADAEVVAVFESATYGDVDVEISGWKGTETLALDGATVTLSNAKAEYEITVTDGKLTQTNVLTGEYTLTVADYVSTTVIVTENGIADAIVLVYNIFTSEPAAADLSKLNEGKVTATGSGGVDLETKEKYVNVTAEAHFDVPDYNSRRYSIALVFADGKNFRIDFCVLDGGSNNILQQTNWGSMMFNWEWVDFPDGYFAEGTNSYTEAEIRNVFMTDGLTYKLEREGATVKLYINGVLMKTYTLSDEYATQEAQLKFIFDSDGTDGTKGFTFDITVPSEGEQG